MKKMLVAVMMLIGLLAGCSDDKFAMEAKAGQIGAGSTVRFDGKDGVMTIVTPTTAHPQGVRYHVARTDQDSVVNLNAVAGYNTIVLHVEELNKKLNFAAVPHQGYLCLECVWLELPQNWAVTNAR